jgi:hypothetical protein
MNGYGLVEKIYRPLGIGIIRSKSKNDDESTTVIFTTGAVQRGSDGFHEFTEGDQVHYRLFDDKVDHMGLARDVWKKG